MDHVPPEQMLQKPPPPNLWTVPACTECNTSYSRDEEYFRAWVIGLFCFNEAAKEMFDGPIRACFDHSPRLKDKVFNSIGVEGERTFVTARATGSAGLSRKSSWACINLSLFLTVYSSIFLQNRGLRNHRGGVAPGAVSLPGADGSTC